MMKGLFSKVCGLIAVVGFGLGTAAAAPAAAPVLEYTGDPEMGADLILDTGPATACQQGSLPGARCLPAEDFLGPHNRLSNVSGLLWLLGTAGLTGNEHVLVAGGSAGDREFVAGLLYLAGQKRISVLTRPLADVREGGLHPGRLRSKTRETVYQAPMRSDRLVLRSELKLLLDSPQPPLLIDGRSEAEFWGERARSPRAGHLPGAQHLAAHALIPAAPERWPEFADDLVAYAHDGYEGLGYLSRLAANGIYARLYLGGWSDWASDGALPVDLLTLPDTSVRQTQVYHPLHPDDVTEPGLLWGLLVFFMLTTVAAAGYLAGRRGRG